MMPYLAAELIFGAGTGVFDDEQPGQWKVFLLVIQDCGELADAACFALYADIHVVD